MAEKKKKAIEKLANDTSLAELKVVIDKVNEIIAELNA